MNPFLFLVRCTVKMVNFLANKRKISEPESEVDTVFVNTENRVTFLLFTNNQYHKQLYSQQAQSQSGLLGNMMKINCHLASIQH